MKKIYFLSLAIAVASLSMAAKTAMKHIAPEPDAPVTQIVDVDHSYDCPEFSEADIAFVKKTWEIMQRSFISKGGLDAQLKSRPGFWHYWLEENMQNHINDGYGYWMAIVAVYETTEFADSFDDDNHEWIKAFKEFGIRKQIAFECEGEWYAYEY